MTKERNEWWKLVDDNIARHGHHITLVMNEVAPSFAYTIGLSPKHGCELTMGGTVDFGTDEIITVVNEIAAQLSGSPAESTGRSFDLGELGAFTLSAVRDEWRALMLGAIERRDDVVALQVLPDEAHRTVEVPRMNEPPSAHVNRAWKWVHEDWPHATGWEVMTTSAPSGGRVVRISASWSSRSRRTTCT